MNRLALTFGCIGIVSFVLCGFQGKRTNLVVITGDLSGYLEPCGCTLPTTGGIRRQANAVKRLRDASDVTLIAQGGMVADNGKQSLLKCQTIAQAYEAMDVNAIGLAGDDLKLGVGGLTAIQNNSSSRVVSGSLSDSTLVPIRSNTVSGPFLIGSACPVSASAAGSLHIIPKSIEAVAVGLVNEAKAQELAPILLMDGSLDEAIKVAKLHTSLRLIVYRSQSNPTSAPTKEGNTMIVTPGSGGKFIVSATWDGEQFSAYQAVSLGPQFSDDPVVAKIYQFYLHQVDRSHLLEDIPRQQGGHYAGSQACSPCHAKAYRTWSTSNHAHALADLEKGIHGRDPDCVKCHVVGLSFSTGYRSRDVTPNLANVGCESCHGPGANHISNPKKLPMPKKRIEQCSTCHTTDQSPNFNPLTYWRRIQHN